MAVNQPTTDATPKNPSLSLSAKAEPKQETTLLAYLREWGDALVIAFVVAMFIRTYVVELFKIPSGSMSPTLLGDFVTEGNATDRDGESHQYLLISDLTGEIIQVFAKKPDGYYDYQGKKSRFGLTQSQQFLLTKLHREEHRILVNKFAYWFKKPERGDVIIFRVPFQMEAKTYERNGMEMQPVHYDRNQNVYVKRAVAFGGEHLAIGDDNHLYVNDKLVTEPEIVGKLQYRTPEGTPRYDIEVPKDHVIAFGDNSDNSLDSRYWGPLPEENLRGQAILTYWPFKNKKFLTPK